MAAVVLIVASAVIILTLGVIHLVYTFRGTKFDPRDPALKTAMKQVSPVLTRETTMWKAWVGFNASHSFGAILFGLIYAYLALSHSALLFHSPFLLATGLVLLIGYWILGKLYWFRIPFTGISLALVCYVAGIVLSLG